MRILDPRPVAAAPGRETLARARELLPGLRDVPVQAQWAGYIDSTPDGVPVIDADIGVPGLILAAGFRAMASASARASGIWWPTWLLGRAPITETAQYRLARFADSQWGKVAKF